VHRLPRRADKDGDWDSRSTRSQQIRLGFAPRVLGSYTPVAQQVNKGNALHEPCAGGVRRAASAVRDSASCARSHVLRFPQVRRAPRRLHRGLVASTSPPSSIYAPHTSGACTVDSQRTYVGAMAGALIVPVSRTRFTHEPSTGSPQSGVLQRYASSCASRPRRTRRWCVRSEPR